MQRGEESDLLKLGNRTLVYSVLDGNGKKGQESLGTEPDMKEHLENDDHWNQAVKRKLMRSDGYREYPFFTAFRRVGFIYVFVQKRVHKCNAMHITCLTPTSLDPLSAFSFAHFC